ncbi:hypothetical protein EYF80_061165 [Liparis tanakae]|uniref:Uncharacterized protein n=1 Tax=Liparis tanakae TaxID=230148 RepID=A0A4Z2EIB5_9TELE|nr:hypothetical protein EYF80_061165 [Liparis tanakae]
MPKDRIGWVKLDRRQGQVGVMGRPQKIILGVTFKTAGQLESDLHRLDPCRTLAWRSRHPGKYVRERDCVLLGRVRRRPRNRTTETGILCQLVTALHWTCKQSGFSYHIMPDFFAGNWKIIRFAR